MPYIFQFSESKLIFEKPPEGKASPVRPNAPAVTPAIPKEGLETRRTKEKTRSTAARADINSVIERTITAGPEAKESKRQQLAFARRVINAALTNLKLAKISTQKAIKKYGIKFKDVDYYLGLSVKESSLDPKTVSRSNAKGLFQIKIYPPGNKGGALDDVNSIFNFNFTETDIFYAGNDQKLQEKASINNAMAGILYWHICRDIRPDKQNLKIKEEDRDKAAAFSYKIGSTTFAELWTHFNPKNFEDFAKKLSDTLLKTFPAKLQIPPKGIVKITDPTYGVRYFSYITMPPDFGDQVIKINGKQYDADNLIGTLRYVELIYSMSVSEPPADPVIIVPPSKFTKAPKVPPPAPAGETAEPAGERGEKIIDTPVEVNSLAEFNEVVLKSKIPVIVDFYTDWCGPCRAMAPSLEQIAKEYKGRVLVVKVKLQAEDPYGPKLNQDIEAKYPIAGYPTIRIFNNGREKKTEVGLRSIEQIKVLIAPYLKTTVAAPAAAPKAPTTPPTPKPTPKPAPPSAPPAPRSAPKPAPKPVPTPLSAPSPAPTKSPAKKPTMPKGKLGIDYEVIRPDQWMWGIAEKLLTRCIDDYKFPYCVDPKITRTDKVLFLIDVIIAYNREIYNPDFEKVETQQGVARGYRVYFPPKEYLQKAIEQSGKTVAPPVKLKPPEILVTQGLYCGPYAARLDKLGAEKFPKTPRPVIITPSGVKPGTISKHGKMTKESVTKVVVHTTEGSPDHLYKTLGIHYIVRTDGTIHLIRNNDVAVDHGGLMANSRSKACWNGDRSPSLHSIGIEVENISMDSLIASGKLMIEADPRQLKKLVIKGKTYFYTEQPPSSTALQSGITQAKRLRIIQEAQYKALKNLVSWLGYTFDLHKKDVVTHSMIGVSIYGRGRKPDPPIFDWEKLGLPDNHYLVDQDVLAGTIDPNLGNIVSERNGTKLKRLAPKHAKKIGKYDRGKEPYIVRAVVIGGVTKYSYVPEPYFACEESISKGIEAAITLRQKNKTTKVR